MTRKNVKRMDDEKKRTRTRKRTRTQMKKGKGKDSNGKKKNVHRSHHETDCEQVCFQGDVGE